MAKLDAITLNPAGSSDASANNLAPDLALGGGAADGTPGDTLVVGLGGDGGAPDGGGLGAGIALIGASSGGSTRLAVGSIFGQAGGAATIAGAAAAAQPPGVDTPAAGGQSADAGVPIGTLLPINEANQVDGGTAVGGGTTIGGGSTIGGTTITYGTAGKLQIQVTYDLSVNSAPAGFQAGFEAAISYFTSTFTNNATISLNVGWGEVTLNGGSQTVTALGQSRWFFDNSSYSQIKGALANHLNSADQNQAFSTLPASDPLGGNYIITTGQARALGILSGTGEDGGVGFNSGDTYTFDPNSRAVSGTFDFIGVAEHEISEVLGRDAAVSTTIGTTTSAHFPIDLYRFTAAGTRATSSTTNPSYFSIDSGTTDLKNWNNASLASGDLGDWAATSPYAADAFNNISNSGVKNDVTAVDTQLLNVMGYDTAQTGLKINLVYDSAALAAPQSFRDGMQAAANLLQAAIANNITINIAVGYGEYDGMGLPNQNTSEGGVNITTGETYSNLRTLLASHETSAQDVTSVNALPNTTSLNGTTNFFISSSEAKAFGLISGTGTTIDGFVGMGTGFTGSTLLGGALHEITHAMGRIPGTSVLSMFRYDSVGNHDFTGGTPAASTYFSINGGNTKLADFGTQSDPSDFLNSSPLTPNDPFDETIAGSALTSVDLTMMDVLGFQLTCFCRGTLILTRRGEVAVEELAVGDRVVTLSGALKPIRWIGMGRDLVTRANKLARPVIVRRGALADGVPTRDLYLTHGHALYLDGALIPVENLVNHRSILWDESARVVEYYHLELDEHDVVLANGAAAESYYDAHNRVQFHNTRLGSAAGAAKPVFAPVLNGGEAVDRVWSKLYERAGGYSDGDTTDDPDLHLVVDGERRDPAQVDGGTYSFALDGPPAGMLLLCSRSGVPSRLGVTRHDHRRLGVAIARIELRQKGLVSTFAHEAPPFLQGGCYPAEDGYSWTDGELELPPSLFAHLAGRFTLTVHTERPGMLYPAPKVIAAAA